MTKFSNSVHFVLQPKGGVGKSFVASILAQFFIKENSDLVCFDTDPNNKTLSDLSSLNCQVVELMRGGRIGEDLIDPMMSSILEAVDKTILIDTGTSNFLSTMAYLNDNGVIDLFIANGRKVYIHVPIVGGGDKEDTIFGLSQLAIALGNNANVEFVVWENDLRGVIRLKDFPIYDYLVEKNLLKGVVSIHVGYDAHGSYRGDTYINDIKKMTESKMIVSDLLAATHYSDGTVIDLMKKHRIQRLFNDWMKSLSELFDNN